MIDRQSSGRRWGWPALALLSLAALLAGAWWLASARPEPSAAFLPSSASRPPPQSARPAHPAHPAHVQPHPASLDAGALPRRRLPLQTSAGPLHPALSAGLDAPPQHPLTVAGANASQEAPARSLGERIQPLPRPLLPL